MTSTNNNRTPEQVRGEIEAEREQLASAVEYLRGEIDEATNVTEKVKARLPLIAAGAAATGFVLSGGIGATMRYLARRGREGHPRATVGRWSIRG
jgi:hypothetical protein